MGEKCNRYRQGRRRWCPVLKERGVYAASPRAMPHAKGPFNSSPFRPLNRPKDRPLCELKPGHCAAACPLVKARSVRYFLSMLRKFVFLSALTVCAGAMAVTADTIQLKDNAAVVGKILAEKHD